MMGCGGRSPFIPGKRYIDWAIEHTKARPVQKVSATHDEVARHVGDLLTELDASRAALA